MLVELQAFSLVMSGVEDRNAHHLSLRHSQPGWIPSDMAPCNELNGTREQVPENKWY